MALLLGHLLFPGATRAEELRLLTSLPPSQTNPMVEAFEAGSSDTVVLVLNKHTNSGVEEVIRGNDRGFDLYLASAPEAFEIIRDNDGFADPAMIGCDAVGPAGYTVIALTSIGWARRTDSALFMPGEWDDLLLPMYRGRIGMAVPSRSGTTHMIVERLMQARGWTEGWRYFLHLSENVSTLTSRSFGVVDGLQTNRFDIGVLTDNLAAEAQDLTFSYGRPVMLIPAQVGILAGGASPDLACDFVRFLTSVAGQRLLASPQIGRIPVLPEVQQSSAMVPEVRHALRLSWLSYDARLARDRYWAVNTLFDVFITERLPERRALWQRYRALEPSSDPGVLRLIHELLTEMPVRELEASRLDLNAAPARVTELTTLEPLQQEALAVWTARADASFAKIDGLLRVLEDGGPP